MNEQKALDILGIKPIGDAINTTVTKTFEGVEGFLKLVCAPALEEVGLLLKDHVRHWRLNNVLRILSKAEGKLEFNVEKLQIKAHPRVALSIIENGSLIDDDEVQELWAGLFVSSCTEDGQDDENLIFVDLLKQLTNIEARILKHSCETARKIYYPNDLLLAEEIQVGCNQLIELTGVKNVHRIDRELDHLRSLNLLEDDSGFDVDDETLTANIRPTALALNLYVKSQGFNEPPSKFWTTNVITIADLNKENAENQRLRTQEEKLDREKRQKEILEKKQASK
jgi:hypothetical protein